VLKSTYNFDIFILHLRLPCIMTSCPPNCFLTGWHKYSYFAFHCIPLCQQLSSTDLASYLSISLSVTSMERCRLLLTSRFKLLNALNPLSPDRQRFLLLKLLCSCFVCVCVCVCVLSHCHVATAYCQSVVKNRT